MKKHLILAFLASSFAILSAPNLLMASEESRPQELDSDKIVKITIIAPEITTSENSKATFSNSSPEPQNIAQAAAITSTPASIPQYISIAGRTIPIIDVATTTAEPGSAANRYGKKFLYGHNSASVFGGLKNLSTGSIFTITENGKVKTYSVAKIVIFEKNGEILQIAGSGNYMKAVSLARFNGESYDLALMTCAGTPLGSGDATHRLVIFANEN